MCRHIGEDCCHYCWHWPQHSAMGSPGHKLGVVGPPLLPSAPNICCLSRKATLALSNTLHPARPTAAQAPLQKGPGPSDCTTDSYRIILRSGLGIRQHEDRKFIAAIACTLDQPLGRASAQVPKHGIGITKWHSHHIQWFLEGTVGYLTFLGLEQNTAAYITAE